MIQTWKPPDQSSLHDFMQNRHALHRSDANFYFFRRQFWHFVDQRSSAIVGRPVRSAAALAATASGQNRTSAMSEANGGAERDRTADPLLAKQVLSQLSYSPNSLGTASADKRQHKARSSTPYPQSSFSQIQPQTRSSTCKSRWWAREDLNFRPHAYQACALTN